MPVSQTPATQTQVFVDGTGRRRRIRRVAYGLLIGACAYGALVIASLLGGPVPPNALLPLPGGQHSPISAGKATSSAHPTTTAKRAGTGNDTTAPGSGPATAAARSASSPAAAPSASPSASATASRHQPPGLAGKSASPGVTGHGH